MAPSASRKMYWLCRERMDERLGELGRKQLDLVRDGNGRSGNEVAVSMSSITRVRRKDAGVGRRVADAIMLALWPEDERPFAERIADYGGDVAREPAGERGGDDGDDGELFVRLDSGHRAQLDGARQESGRFREFFLLGCCVGNRLQVASPGGRDHGDLKDFLGMLADVVPSSRGKCEEIRNISDDLRAADIREEALWQLFRRVSDSGEAAALLMKCMDAMNSVTEIVRRCGTKEESSWYTLGRLLMELPTASMFRGKNDAEAIAAADALQIFIEGWRPPALLERRVIRLAQSVRTGEMNPAELGGLVERLRSTIERAL